MSRPVVSAAGERMYVALAAYAGEDEANGWALLHRCEAMARMLAKPNDVLRADETGSGWRRTRDPDRAAAWVLPWLAQHVGIDDLPVGLAEADQRTLIRDAPGMRRGTPGVMIAAAQRHLTGNRTVILVERDGGAYQLSVVTRTDETPDPDAVLAAIISQKPAGIILSYSTATGEVWSEAVATWATVGSGVTWGDMTDTTI